MYLAKVVLQGFCYSFAGVLVCFLSRDILRLFLCTCWNMKFGYLEGYWAVGKCLVSLVGIDVQGWQLMTDKCWWQTSWCS